MVNVGPKFVSGSAVTGRVIMTRDDGTADSLPIIMCLGTLIDNEDLTFDIAELGS